MGWLQSVQLWKPFPMRHASLPPHTTSSCCGVIEYVSWFIWSNMHCFFSKLKTHKESEAQVVCHCGVTTTVGCPCFSPLAFPQLICLMVPTSRKPPCHSPGSASASWPRESMPLPFLASSCASMPRLRSLSLSIPVNRPFCPTSHKTWDFLPPT